MEEKEYKQIYKQVKEIGDNLSKAEIGLDNLRQYLYNKSNLSPKDLGEVNNNALEYTETLVEIKNMPKEYIDIIKAELLKQDRVVAIIDMEEE